MSLTPFGRHRRKAPAASAPRVWRLAGGTILLGAVSVLVLAPSARADRWAPHLTILSTWNDNAPNANAASDQIGALQAMAEVAAGERFGLGRDDSLHLTLRAGGEWWPRFSRLSQGTAGARFEWRHKFGLGAFAPVFSVELAADAVAANLGGRNGTSAGVLLGFRQRFDTGWRAGLTQEFAAHAARQAVYDRAGAETAIEVDRDVGELTRLNFRAGYRDGDILSHGTPPRPDLMALAPNRLTVETFGRSMVAYSIEARTVAIKAGLTRAIAANSALVGSYEWRETSRSPFRYVNHLVSLALVHQF
jgi:opacity protein-like surface antigen